MIGRRYEQGFKDGHLAAVQNYERVVALLREELSDARQLAQAQAHRADSACDLLLGHLGVRAISLAGQQAEAERTEQHIRNVEAITALPDIDQEFPIGDPRGRYQSLAEAKLDYQDLTSNG